MEPVRAPEKYLLTILQSGQLATEKEAPPPLRKTFDTKAERLKLIEQFMANKRAELSEMFQEMPEQDQQQWITRFEQEALPAAGAIRKAFQSKGVQSQIVRPVFLKFLGNSVWEDGWEKPSESELTDLAIRMKNEQAATLETRMRLR